MSLIKAGQEPEFFASRMLTHHRARWSNLPGMSEAELAERHKYAYCSVRWRNYILMRVEPCDHAECASCQQVHLRCLPEGHPCPYTDNLDHYEKPRPGTWQLFDVEADLYQTKEISADHPGLVKQMSDFYEQWWDGIWNTEKETA
jgi:hypothetical protein